MRIFDGVLSYKLSGKLSCLEDAVSLDDPYTTLFHSTRWRVAVDAGAYTGDTAAAMLQVCPAIDRLYAVEPDPRTYKKLQRFSSDNPVVSAVWSAVTDRVGEVAFRAAGGRGARAGQGHREISVPCVTIDSLKLPGCDHIKYDVEGEEAGALNGSAGTIRNYDPELLVSLYHRSEDLFALPLLAQRLYPGYRMFLRRKAGFPAWDLNLICTRNS